MKQILFSGFMLMMLRPVQAQEATSPRTILAILAHPDDESAFGQVLARYAREGNEVWLIIAADGRFGVEEHAGIPAGDSLAMVRAEESRQACEKLGIHPPVFLGAHDGFGSRTSIGTYFDQTFMLRDRITEQIAAIDPDVIITFGPDGDTGHMDHRGISDLVTEVLLMHSGWYEKYPLYYLAWPQEKKFWMPQGEMTSLNYVDAAYRNVRITYTREDQETFFRTLSCYKSQYTPEDIQKWIEAELTDTSYTFYFRQLVVNTDLKKDF